MSSGPNEICPLKKALRENEGRLLQLLGDKRRETSGRIEKEKGELVRRKIPGGPFEYRTMSN